MASQTRSAPASIIDTGGVSFTNVENVGASDNSYASVTSAAAGNRPSFLARDFGFSIPGGATIDGILVEIEDFQSVAGDWLYENIELYFFGITGDNRGDNSEVGTSENYQGFGGSADTWNSAVVTDPDVINSADFGTQIGYVSSDGASSELKVDNVRITVYYTATGNRRRRALMTRAA